MDWKTTKWNRTKLRDADKGDIFAVQHIGTGDVVARYEKVNHKKRCFKSVESGGFVSPYDITMMHEECKFILFARTVVGCRRI